MAREKNKKLEEFFVVDKVRWLPSSIFISINEYVSEYGGSLVKIGSHWSLSIHFWKYHISIARGWK